MSHLQGKRVTIFTGHFGSGKTEISVNYILKLKAENRDLALVDLDFINPYFRSRENKDYLNSQGITVIASASEYFDTDLPALSPQIGGVLANPQIRVVVDLGGDETGARAIGRFRNRVAEDQYELLFVVNPFRPFTGTPEEVHVIAEQIEASSRLKITGLVSNPHLLTDTSVSDIVTGHETVIKTALLLGVPIKMITVEDRFHDLPEITGLGLPVLSITRQMTKPWERPD